MSELTSWNELRRVVTGVNDAGNSIVLLDDNLPNRHLFNKSDGLHEIWTAPAGSMKRSDSSDQTDREVVIAPSAGEVRIRYFTLSPVPESVRELSDSEVQAETRKIFSSVGAGEHQPNTSKHPAMHLTPSIDCIILLKGRVKLILDEDEVELEQFNTVIQRGTNHAWEVIGSEPALLAAILIYKEFTDE